MGEKSSKKKWILIAACILLFLAALISGIFVIRGQMSENTYREAIRSAEKYMESGDYELAVLQYQNAIEERPEDEAGYIALADLYLQQGETSAAKILLKRGAAHTGSSRIEYMLRGFEDGSILVNAGAEEMKKQNMQSFGLLTLNTAFLQKLEHYDYSDYCEQFGSSPEIAVTGDGSLEVVHGDLSGTCYYANTEEQDDIVDEKRDLPVEDGMPEKVSLDSMTQIFHNFQGKIQLSELNALSSTKVTPIVKKDRTYVELTTASLIIRIETNAEGTIVSDTAWNEIILTNANKDRSKAGMLAGVIVDASTGKGVAGAEIEFRAESGSADNNNTTAAGDGSFSVELEPGEYTVIITADGYAEEVFEFEMEKDKNYSGEQFVISPELAAGTARIVLEWNAQPQDLDSYLIGETDREEDVFVNFSNHVNRGSDRTIAELDVDDRDGYGPETITLNDLNGVYTYSVEDYRHTGTLQQNGATVKVYLPGQGSPTVITLDPNAGVQNVWEVFTLDHGELTVLNRVSAESDIG